MTATIINSAEGLSKFIGELRETWGTHKFVRVTVKTGKDRSLDYNALSHCWYQQVADELREDTALGVKNFCKLNFGIPILRAEDDEFRTFYDAGMKLSLNYEQKIKAMAYMPVSSLLTQKQFDQYARAMQEHYRTRGVVLEFPTQDEQPKRRRKA